MLSRHKKVWVKEQDIALMLIFKRDTFEGHCESLLLDAGGRRAQFDCMTNVLKTSSFSVSSPTQISLYSRSHTTIVISHRNAVSDGNRRAAATNIDGVFLLFCDVSAAFLRANLSGDVPFAGGLAPHRY